MTYQALKPFLEIKDSPVAGQGVFAKEDIPADTKLGNSHMRFMPKQEDNLNIIRTPLGGFMNHSDDPNCVKWGNKYDGFEAWFIKTIKPIKKGEELFLKYTFYQVV